MSTGAALLLHIGSPKTGTTTLQQFLRTNRELLRVNGVRYPLPADATLRQALMMAAAVQSPDSWPRQFQAKFAEDPEPIQAMARTFFDQIRTQDADEQITVLSNEHMMGYQLPEIRSLLDSCGATAATTTVVSYVREPTSYWVSTMAQRLLGSTTLPNPFGGRGGYHVAANIRRWTSALGTTSLEVRAFDRSLLTGSNVCTDFLAILGQRRPLPAADFDFPQDTNQSLSAEELILLQELREEWLELADNSFAPESWQLVNCIKKHAETFPTTPARLAPATVSAFHHRCADDLAWMRDVHGISFTEAAPEPAPEQLVDDVLELMDEGRVRKILAGYDPAVCAELRTLVGRDLGYLP